MKLSDLQQLSAQLGRETVQADAAQLRSLLAQWGYDPDKLYQELEMESRYVDTHRDTSYSNSRVQLHSHTFYELLYCTNSCGAEYLVGAERYRLQKGDIVLVPPGVSHRPILPEHMDEPYCRDILWLSPEYIREVYGMLGADPQTHSLRFSLLRTAGTRWAFLGNLFRAGVIEAQNREAGWELAVLGNTAMLLTNLYRALGDRNAGMLRAEKPELLEQVMAYVEEHLAQKITLSDTAKRFFVSESTISHTFQQKLGTGFYSCVTQRRLIAAKNLIQEGSALEEVAGRVGFTDYSTFYRAFKREYGISPRQYRQLRL